MAETSTNFASHCDNKINLELTDDVNKKPNRKMNSLLIDVERNLLLSKLNSNHQIYHMEKYAYALFSGKMKPVISHVCPPEYETTDLQSTNLQSAKKPTLQFVRELTSEYPRLPYVSRQREWKWSLHWGQLKMFLNELDFLTRIVAQTGLTKFTLLYVGNLYGAYFTHVLDMFPEMTVLLYTENDVEKEIANHPRVKHYKEKFSVDMCYYLTTENIDTRELFLYSNIRSGTSSKSYKQDMDEQVAWLKILTPRMSSIKFKLEYPGSGVDEDVISFYPDGQLLFCPFTSPTSTETRLIINNDFNEKKYSCRAYEEKMFYHNSVARKQSYLIMGFSDLELKSNGLCNCYDCKLFAEIVISYLMIVKKIASPNAELVFGIIKLIQTNIVPGKNLYTQTITNIHKYWTILFFKSYRPCKYSCTYCKLGTYLKERAMLDIDIT
jgi:hypothetical protein